MEVKELLDRFITQAESGDLKTSTYPKDWHEFSLKVSFGMGSPARVPWVAFITPEISVSNGYYPVYLYYKNIKTLVLAFGVSETNESKETWPPEVVVNFTTIKGYLGVDASRYGDSYVFKTYTVSVNGHVSLKRIDSNEELDSNGLGSDLDTMLELYRQAASLELTDPDTSLSQGVFYMEKQLEDFLIQNWGNTELGKKYDLIVEEGLVKSQQYRAGEAGSIDILVKDKTTGSYVVIELKKNQTSDDTIGQIMRYMGWVQEKLGDPRVRGVIIAKGYDQKFEFALKQLPNVEVYVYEIDFRLKEFK